MYYYRILIEEKMIMLRKDKMKKANIPKHLRESYFYFITDQHLEFRINEEICKSQFHIEIINPKNLKFWERSIEKFKWQESFVKVRKNGRWCNTVETQSN